MNRSVDWAYHKFSHILGWEETASRSQSLEGLYFMLNKKNLHFSNVASSSKNSLSEFFYCGNFRCSPETPHSPQLNQVVIENMLRLPGLSADTLLNAVQGNAFDHVSAIYHLLADRLETTLPALPSIQNISGDYMPDGAHQLEKVNQQKFSVTKLSHENV